MKKIFFVLLCLPLISLAQKHYLEQTDSVRITQEKKQIALEAKPVFVKATALILELREDVKLAKEGTLKKTDVVNHFNSTAGTIMGKETTLSGVDKRLKESGDAYVQLLFLKEEARIAYLKAAEAKYDATH